MRLPSSRLPSLALACAAAFAGLSAPAPAATFSSNAGITINDGNCPPPGTGGVPSQAKASPYPSTIAVSGLPITSTVTDVDVTLTNFTHSFPSDTRVLLVGPAGQTALLMHEAGGTDGPSGPESTAVTDVTFTLDDQAAGTIADPILPGSYRPTRTESNCPDVSAQTAFPAPAPVGSHGLTLGGSSGTNPNGTWSVYVVDDAFGDVGDIEGWALSILTTPTTTITAGPPPAPGGATNDPTPTFSFSSDDAGATFRCRDGGAGGSGSITPCSSPHTLAPQPDGQRHFEVYAVDAAGNQGGPTTWFFEVDTIAPITSITSGPDATTSDPTPQLFFRASDGKPATFMCRIDAAAEFACSSPYTAATLPDGDHSFTVRATDLAGNLGPETTRAFTVTQSQPVRTSPACPPEGLATGAVYRGTHAQGGAVCFTLSTDFSSVNSFLATAVRGDICGFDRQSVGLWPIAERSFSSSGVTGAFPTAREAQGSLVFDVPSGVPGDSRRCRTPTVTWSASTDATPPWALMTTDPTLPAPGAVPAPAPAPAVDRLRVNPSTFRATSSRARSARAR